MQSLRNKIIFVVAVMGAFSITGAVLASEGEADDTVINHGYDEDSRFFMWNVTSLDYQPYLDAIADDDTIGADDFDALLDACGLEVDSPDPAEYQYSFDGDTITLTLPDGSEYEGTCGEFVGSEVTGPAGQVNHGMFLKTFNALFDGPKRGCIVRHIAQSDLGKGDQQVAAGDDADSEPTEPTNGAIQGSVTFTTVAADCQHGKKAKNGDESENAKGDDKGGPPQHVLDKFGGEHPKNAKSKQGKEDRGNRP